MFNRWAALALVLALGALIPQNVEGQVTSQRKSGMGQNYPNPYNPATEFRFSIWEPSCETDPSSTFQVTMRMVTILGQTVGRPTLQAPSAGTASSGQGGKPLLNLRLACGDYTGRWEGKLLGSGKEAPSGVYIAELFVDGKQRGVIRTLIAK